MNVRSNMGLNTKQFLTTAEVARKLGLSIGSVQKRVDSGELQAMRTHGGHRRIAVESLMHFMATHGYSTTVEGNAIGIFHHGHDLDPKIQEVNAETQIRLMSHPMELLDMNGAVETIFIDARSPWLQSTPISMLEGLCQKHQVFIYNANILMLNSKWRDLPSATMIQRAITLRFIEGFCLARQVGSESQKSLSKRMTDVLAGVFEKTALSQGPVLQSY
jgi:excisionase family DNA binding protein